jgi:ribonuclease P protein component
VKGPEAFGPERRLPTKADFDRVFADARIRIRRHPFMLLALPRPAGPARLGFVVGKKHARRAVKRNLIRRIGRESFRLSPIEQPVDVILLARPGADQIDARELRATLDHLWSRLARETAQLDTRAAAEASP